MVKGVFESKPGSGYKDDVTRHYHFPRRYLPMAEAVRGDWIVYREPQTGGGSGSYFAAARVDRIERDPDSAGHYYARVDGYLPFDAPVPLRRHGRLFEAALREAVTSNIGHKLQGRSVRTLSDEDFGAIVRAGLGATLAPENAARLGLDQAQLDPGTAALLGQPPAAQGREVAQLLLNRKVRDAAFRHQVCAAYDDTCAVTRLRIVNGGGRAEVQAAHIWPVAEGGPDVVQNGVALSATAHWLFDRHLISLTDEYGLLVSHNKVPAELRVLFHGQLRQIHLPQDRRLWPNPAYVRRHREAFAG